jgi:hypothetical protein
MSGPKAPNQQPDDPFAEIKERLDKAARIGQKILAPFLYIICGGGGVVLAIGMSSPHSDFPAWPTGAIVGVIIAWLVVRASYYLIKWALVVLGIYAIGTIS